MNHFLQKGKRKIYFLTVIVLTQIACTGFPRSWLPFGLFKLLDRIKMVWPFLNVEGNSIFKSSFGKI
jgi:hypothetical protein